MGMLMFSEMPESRGSRTFLFLQGPHGVFFRRLADELIRLGHRVERINFNGGDRRDWSNQGRDYTGNIDGWPIFIDGFLADHDVTDLILYGDCRPLHRIAQGIAKLRGCRTYVFEEGYIRPDFMTMEQDGVNGNSSLPSDPAWYVEQAALLETVQLQPLASPRFERRIREALGYHVASLMGRLHFRRYQSHRPKRATVEAIAWLLKWYRRGHDRRRSDETLAAMIDRPYFCVPLQLASDHQIRTHSPFPDMAVAAAYIIRSFARHAPADTVLILKQHPLAADLFNYKGFIERTAGAQGVRDRVAYVEEADIASLVAQARGVVTVNSTTGTLALRSGVPTIVLGHAVYDMPRITHQGSLDAFWQHPVPPEPGVYDAFCRVLVDRCLIHGGYLHEEGLALLVAGAVDRLDANLAVQPARASTVSTDQ